MNSVYKLLPIDRLQRGCYQPRLNFDQTALQELAQSILSQGLIEPLIVRETIPERFEILAGERRWRAAQIAGLTEVPCLIGSYSDAQACALTLVENIQRQELNLIEEASAYRRLCDEFHYHQDEIAALTGKSRSHIANILRLLTLCADVRQDIQVGRLSLGHARLLVGMTPRAQQSLAQQVIAGEWSVRTLEEKVRVLKTNAESTAGANDTGKDVRRLETLLSEQIGAPVQIVSEKNQGGWLRVKFFDNETLAGLLERMGLRYD